MVVFLSFWVGELVVCEATLTAEYGNVRTNNTSQQDGAAKSVPWRLIVGVFYRERVSLSIP